MVPNGWEIKKLDEIARVTSGGTPSRSKAEYWQDGTIPWIRTTEVQNCYLYLNDTQEFITLLGMNNSSAKIVPINSLLLAMIGQGKTRGQVALLKFEATTNQNCAVIILNSSQSPEFYFQYLLSQYQTIRNMSNSAGQSNLSGALIKEFKVHVPPIEEQHKIAEILSTWDKAIASTENLITNSQMQKKTLMQQLLTGKKRLLDENGVKFSGEWENKKISSFLTESKKPSVENDPKKRLTVRLHLKGIEARDFRGTEAENSTNHFIRRSGQFIYGRQNFHKGAFGIIPKELDFYESSQDIPCFDFSDKCSPKWLFYMCSRKHFYEFIENLMTGTGSKRLHPSSFLKIELPTPSLTEQDKIAAVLSNADREIELLQAKLEHLKQEKKALMQQLLTGKRRVKGE